MDDVADLPSSSTYSEDLEYWPYDHEESFDFSETGFLSFVPPPPRPMFLEDISPDGVTTCDMCSWAMKKSNALTLEGKDAPGEVGWVLTLVIVSLTSALIGAVIMIIVLHCKRLKNSSVSEQDCGISLHHRQLSTRPPLEAPSDDKEISTITPANFPNVPMSMPTNVNGVWSWLARRSNTPPSNLNHSPNSHVMENHYTHMEDQYNVEEALYAELDRDNLNEDDRESNSSPAYQNSAYTDTDAPTSSAPSSAYYSDLSVGTMPERAYEIVGLSTLPSWDPCGAGNIEMRRTAAPSRLAAISENVGNTVPSDYV
ncbi:uncharacterized protein LOC126740177 isoform X2 [Anthonomus grandis grandis]|uniref:uncharacterized protein LOC126740177 isoform X2 n=1 Tax=Anthonomus grandis grandis TaxID=2921223 RepID=UPI00216555E9|nr:uncharacterized protein LOC126740177 isoform X2 [Anthonomus grandis grandis]